MIETRAITMPWKSGGMEDNAQMKVSTQCLRCAHWHRNLKCKAFPGGIPYPISYGRFNHNMSFEGDNGIRFRPKR